MSNAPIRIAAMCLQTGALVFSSASFDRAQSRAQVAAPVDSGRSQSSAPDPRIYDSDPDNIWNRLFRLSYVRNDRTGHQYGGDELDPYLWSGTRYLLSGPSHDQALKLLDEFLQQHSEKLILDRVKRAVFQRDLLAVYEWLAARSYEHEEGRSELQQQLAEVIRRIALSADEIEKLPNNYDEAVRTHTFLARYDSARAEPFLPADLFDEKGPWVCLGEQHGRPVASDHLDFFQGRSAFLVFFQVPGGRSRTLQYLKKLRDIPNTWGPNPDRRQPVGFAPALVPYPEPPQFPVGTRMALIRRAVLIDDHGQPTTTDLTESVQIRVYRAIHFDLGGTGAHSQDVFEFVLRRKRLFSGQAGGLQPISQGDREFAFFHSHGVDVFEMDEAPEHSEGLELRSCSNCHEAAGLHSFLSFSRERFGPTDVPPPKLFASTPFRESEVQIQWIKQHGRVAQTAR